MSERKVLNKYYPPDFDPSKIPRMKLARNRQYTVRLMAPFNMRCKTCGEYIYKGKKFNARKEDVEGDDYLGIRIYRFYIKCTRCLQEISFKTDPKNTDYEIEAGATRNFMALKLAEEQAQREEDEAKEEEATNPMKLLEKRTQQSKHELELLESLEELKDLNRRQQTIDYEQMLQQYDTEAARQKTLQEQEEEDEAYIKTIFGKKAARRVVLEEEIIPLDGDIVKEPPKKVQKTSSREDQGREAVAVADFQKSNDTLETTGTGSTSISSSLPLKKVPLPLNPIKKKANLGIVIRPKATSSATKAVELEQSKNDSEKEKKSGLSLLAAYSDSGDSGDNGDNGDSDD